MLFILDSAVESELGKVLICLARFAMKTGWWTVSLSQLRAIVVSLQMKDLSISQFISFWMNLVELNPIKIPSSSNRGRVSFEFAFSGRKQFFERNKAVRSFER
ncbi:unnamed protein product [Meloidogyne enterolobii]|uniref:Uncharacterized protein n=1 Tax=Meloidogyne enterolobii TaxID=390850 RepID=A0ACB0XQ72_MELEN